MTSVGLDDWNRAAGDYDRVSRMSRAHQDKFARVTELLLAEKPETVLDLGCGSGLLAKNLIEHGFAGTAECLDGSSEMLALAKRNLDSGNCRFTLQDLSRPLRFTDGAFGVVTAINVMFCLDDRDAFAAEVHRVLEPGGLFLCVMPKPKTEGTTAFLREHFKGMPIVEATREIVRLIPAIPSVIRTARFGSELEKRHEISGNTFMDEDAIVGVLMAADFAIENTEDIQANENWLFAARKG